MAARGLLALLVALGLAASACSSSESDDVGAQESELAADVSAFEVEPAETNEAVEESKPTPAAFVYNERLARTVNLGGRFEPPRGAEWTNDLEPSDLDAVAEQGFTAVRLPIRFSDWAQPEEPYAIEEELIDDVAAFIDRAEELGMAIIIDLHHYREMETEPQAHRDRLVGIWRQIVAEFGDRDPDVVSFELLNEPNGALDEALWNEVLADVVEAIRAEGSDHTLIFGPASWNNLTALDALVLPDDDNSIVTFHYYEPFEFTHQGADWVEGSMDDIGTRWSADVDSAGDAIDADFAMAAAWAAERQVPLFLGEFGVLTVADRGDRLEWKRFTRLAAEKYGISWAVFDLNGEKFGIYDDATGIWDDEALSALFAPG